MTKRLAHRDDTEDAREFGVDRWVYCKWHLRPHTTGWCTASASGKILLDARDHDAAYAEARAKGLKIYGESD
jgi:hypothetical protein